MSTENRPPPLIFVDDMDPGTEREPTPPDLFAKIRAALVNLKSESQTEPVKKPKKGTAQ